MANLQAAAVAAVALFASEGPGAAAEPAPRTAPVIETSYIAVSGELTLRRMVVRSPQAKRTVLLLHGFPETAAAWSDISLALADEFEVHAFDWPGFGLSSRPPAERFSYAPRDYARVLRAYIEASGIDRSTLTIYATDIGALPALLLALDEPDIARRIIVGDFAPFDRPDLMQANLQALKAKPSSDAVRAQMNAGREEILANVFHRGMAAEDRFDLSHAFRADIGQGWDHGDMTSADAFYHYYAHFTRDQQAFEAGLGQLRTPVRVVWGADDRFIGKQMGVELAARIGADATFLAGVGHYPHLQVPERTIAEIRASAR